MKKLLMLLFTCALAFSLAMPVFAQDTSQQPAGQQSSDQGTPKKEKKPKKAKKAKKSKMEKKSDTSSNPQ